MLKKLIRYLYRRFVGETYIAHNVFYDKSPELSKNIRGVIRLRKDKGGRFEWLEIETAEGYSSWEYISYPFHKFNHWVPKTKVRLHEFAYKLEEEAR